MENTWVAVHRLCSNSETIVVTVDADDALIGDDVVDLVKRTYAEGADVRAYDPAAKPHELLRGVTLWSSALEAVDGADAAVIVTEWDEFSSLASAETRDAMRRPLIIDGRNLLDPEATRAAGFDYEGIGRASSPLAALAETGELASVDLPSETTGQISSAENAEHFSRD